MLPLLEAHESGDYLREQFSPFSFFICDVDLLGGLIGRIAFFGEGRC